jgi:hypothetical protein
MPLTRADPLSGTITVDFFIPFPPHSASHGVFLQTTTTISNGIQAAVDLLIAISMCFLLYQSRSGFKQ